MTAERRAAWLVVALLLLQPISAWAQWASMGDVGAPRRDDNHTVTFSNRQATVRVSVLSPEMIRIRFAPGPGLGRDHSYAVVSRNFGDPGATIKTGPAETVISTRALRVTLHHRPFRVGIADAAGDSLYEEDGRMGTAFSGAATRVFTRLRPDEQIYGLGEKNGKLNRRGKMLGGYSYTMWNSDVFGYDAS